VVAIHTSPDDLLTDQPPSSAASAPELAPRTNAAVKMRRNPPALSITYLTPRTIQPSGVAKMFQDRMSGAGCFQALL
jgi:hypothetical protein